MVTRLLNEKNNFKKRDMKNKGLIILGSLVLVGILVYFIVDGVKSKDDSKHDFRYVKKTKDPDTGKVTYVYT